MNMKISESFVWGYDEIISHWVRGELPDPYIFPGLTHDLSWRIPDIISRMDIITGMML